MKATIREFTPTGVVQRVIDVTDEWVCSACREPSPVAPCVHCGSMGVGRLSVPSIPENHRG